MNEEQGTGKKWGMKAVYAVLCVLLCLAVFSARACRARKAPPRPEVPAREAAPAEMQDEAAGPVSISAPIRVVTLAGAPLPNMMPIATLLPNAFDEPVAKGPLTNAAGESRIRFPATEKVALRAWDPELRYFPNNFYDVLPGTGTVTETLVVTMVESGAVEALLMMPDGRPARGENTGLMMFHPVHGPWWPAEADANERGEVVFRRVPPGNFVLRLRVASGAAIEVAETFIPPGDTAHLGIVYLQ